MPASKTSPWVQTASGRAVDLVAPTASMIDFDTDVAEHLARQTRFAGACRSGVFSIAQHCVLGADALYRETSRRDMAAAFLLHDAHEYVLGDWIAPAFEALCLYAGAAAAVNGIMKPLGSFNARVATQNCVSQGMTLMKEQLDRAIYGAAGVAFPLPHEVQMAVREMDLRMLKTEVRHLLGPCPGEWGEAFDRAEPVRVVGKLRVWPWPEAADEFRDRLRRYLPDYTSLALRTPRPRPRQDTAQKRQLSPV